MTEKQKNDIINALKRLERIGSESSRTNQKLREAVEVVADKIIDLFPEGVDLPRRLKIVEEQDEDPQEGSYYLLAYEDPDESGAYAYGGTIHRVSGGEISTIYRFAQDLADGLMNELAEWLEKWNAQCEKTADMLKELAEKELKKKQ